MCENTDFLFEYETDLMVLKRLVFFTTPEVLVGCIRFSLSLHRTDELKVTLTTHLTILFFLLGRGLACPVLHVSCEGILRKWRLRNDAADRDRI